MTGTDADPRDRPSGDGLSEAQRAAIFAKANSATRVNRRGSLRAVRIGIPRKAIIWTVVAMAVLGFGGVIGERYLPSFGSTTPTTLTKPKLQPSSTTLPSNSLASLQAYMGLKFIGTATAKGIALRSQHDRTWRLREQKGKVVVLGFYDSNCQDICPVVGAEIKDAQALLGPNAGKVDFAIVNTDPQLTRVSAKPAALLVPGIDDNSQIVFLTGSVAQLDTVWRHYGVRINVGAKPNQVSHNNAMYFVGPSGALVAYATPFARLTSEGNSVLSAAATERFAKGIAETAVSLLH